MRHLPWSLCVLLVVSTVSAQESSTQNTPAASEAALAPLVLEVRAQRVSRSALSEALAKELRQKPAKGETEVPSGALSLSDSADDIVRLTYRDATGRETTRDLHIASDDPEALEKITIAAANLVRDQSGALSQLEAEARAEEAAALAALAQQKPPAPAPPKEQPKPAYDPCHPPVSMAFGVDLAWLVGTSTSRAARESARRVSLGLAGTYSAGASGFEASIFGNIDRKGTCGFQLAVGFNADGGDVRGVTVAIANLAFAKVRGAQLGILNFARRGVHGAQLGVANISASEGGLQIGVVNGTGWDSRMQLGVANYARGTGRAQIGVANVNWGSTRFQLGVLNVARDNTRFQLGVANYTGSGDSVGLLNIVKNGRTDADVWINENGALLGVIKHGGRRVYNMYGVGTRFEKDSMPLALTLGIVPVLYRHERFSLDLQILSEFYARVDPSWQLRAQVARLRLAADIKLTKRVSLVPAVGYALMVTTLEDESTQAPFGETKFRPAGTNADGSDRAGLFGFPTFGLGVRFTLADRTQLP